MRARLGASLGPWAETARGMGFFIILVAGSAALGFAIALPLWLLATRARQLYTILFLAATVGGVAFLLVRSALRRRRRSLDAPGSRRSPLAALLSAILAILVICGLYALAALAWQGWWLPALAALPVWAFLLWLLGRARRAVKARMEPVTPAETRGE
jgi:hypothetical protein